jgi:hypothetical protein
MRRLVLPCLLLLAAIPFTAFAADTPGGGPARVALTIDPAGLTVQGVVPNGSIAWFGVEQEVDPDFSVTRRAREGVVLAGADGVARIDLDPPPAKRALWVVVDLQSGDFVAGTPEGYRLNRLDRGKVPCRGDIRADSRDDGLLDDRTQIEGVMVRPGVGVWRFSGSDGGPEDDDGEHDAHLRLALPAFRALGSSPKAPSKIEGRDLWFVIDPVAMNLSVLKGGVAQ